AELRLEDLVARFLPGTLPGEEWTHEAHLAVGLWHVHRYGAEEAIDRLRAGITALNARHGTPNTETRGYHETITVAYVRLLDQFLNGTAGSAGTSGVSASGVTGRSAFAQSAFAQSASARSASARSASARSASARSASAQSASSPSASSPSA